MALWYWRMTTLELDWKSMTRQDISEFHVKRTCTHYILCGVTMSATIRNLLQYGNLCRDVYTVYGSNTILHDKEKISLHVYISFHIDEYISTLSTHTQKKGQYFGLCWICGGITSNVGGRMMIFANLKQPLTLLMKIFRNGLSRMLKSLLNYSIASIVTYSE